MHYGHMTDWADSYWMIPMMFLWLIALGAVVYAAVRLAHHDSRHDG